MARMTEKKKKACKRNFASYRIRGMIATTHALAEEFPQLERSATRARIALKALLSRLKETKENR